MTFDARTSASKPADAGSGILGRLAPTLEPALARPGRHVPCPVHGGSDGFRVFRDVEETGGGICNSCGPRRGGFALLMWANVWGFRETLEAVARDLGLDTGHSQSIAARPRSVVVALTDQDPNFPALVAKVSDAEGRSVSLHRIYLDRAEHKARTHPKKMMPPIGTLCGGAVRPYPAGATLGITEGIETAPVIRQRTAMPVWAGISATLLQRFVPPPGVDLVVIWPIWIARGPGSRPPSRCASGLLPRHPHGAAPAEGADPGGVQKPRLMRPVAAGPARRGLTKR